MASASRSSRSEEENSQILNPNSPQNEENITEPPSPPHSPAQSPQTLEAPDPQNPQDSLLNQPQDHHQQEDNQQEGSQSLDQQDPEDHIEQSSGMSLSVLQPITDVSPQPPLTSPTNQYHRRFNKRKKGGLHIKKLQAIEKKVQNLTETLKPIPFTPSKTLDFARHEKLLKRLGLWDFVQIEFDKVIRVDLIGQLIVTYDQKMRCGYVNEFRINVNRADLARALKLPVKKEKGNASNNVVLDGVELDSVGLSEESIGFIEDFVSNWVLLHEDTWILPSEVLNWTRAIKDRHPEKVDWASLFWFMVEKELTQGLQLENCYYASHLQCLIKSQREEVLRAEPPKVGLEVEVKEEEDGGGDVDVKVCGLDESKGHDNVVVEEPNIELTLGQDVVEEVEVKDDEMMDVEEHKEEEHGGWLLDGKNNMGEHFLQHCRSEEIARLDIKEEIEEGEEEQEEEDEDEDVEGRFHIGPNDDTLETDGLTGNLLQGMETTHISFSSQGQLCEHAPVELHASRAQAHTSAGGPFFGNAGKREIGLEHGIAHNSLDGSHKRLRTDGSWDHKSSDFGICMDEALQWMEKARMMYDAKEQALQESNLNQQLLLSELQRRDSVIEHLHKTKCEEIQKRDGEIFRLERELFVMGNLIEGYRKALKETHKAFGEYRQRCQLPEEPIYKDAGPGGLVLSTTELEKQREKQEEEDRLNRLVFEQKIKDVLDEYFGLLKIHLNRVCMLDNRLLGFETEVKLLKEKSAKGKASEISGCAPTE